MATNLTKGYAVVTGFVGGVQLHGSSGLRGEVVRGAINLGS